MKTVLNLPEQTRVLLSPKRKAVQGETLEGGFFIEGIQDLRFTITNYDVPHSDLTGGVLIRIWTDTEETLCSFRPHDVEKQSTNQESYLAKAFLVALAGFQEKINGFASIDPVPFPLPAHLQSTCTAGGEE